MRRESFSETAEKIRDEMAQRVVAAAWPPRPGETKERMLERAARKLGMALGRVKRLAYREVKNVPAAEADHLRRYTGCLEAFAERITTLEREIEASRAVSRQLELDFAGLRSEAGRRFDVAAGAEVRRRSEAAD